MGECRPIVAVHYGDWVASTGVPSYACEDMYPGLENIGAYLKDTYDVHLEVTRRQSPVRADGSMPDIVAVRNPIFEPQEDGSSLLLNPNWTQGSLQEYALVIDRDVDNFHGELIPGGERIARGLGLSACQTLNAPGMQNMGNDKNLFRTHVTEPLGIAAPTYSVDEQGIDLFERRYGNVRCVVKPTGGSAGEKIQIFASLHDARRAKAKGDIKETDILEPYANQRLPIPGLRALHKKDQDTLDGANQDPTRVGEVRFHYGAYTDAAGKVHPWAYPTYRAGPPQVEIMGTRQSIFVPLDPECAPPAVYGATLKGIGLVMKATDVPHVYGTLDWKLTVLSGGERIWQCGDGNCRSPYLPPDADHARKAFMDMWGLIAWQNMSQK